MNRQNCNVNLYKVKSVNVSLNEYVLLLVVLIVYIDYVKGVLILNLCKIDHCLCVPTS